MKRIKINLTNANEIEINEFIDFKKNHNFNIYEIEENIFETTIFENEEIEQYKNLVVNDVMSEFGYSYK